jgi:tRNA-dihydrouridine synthase B
VNKKTKIYLAPFQGITGAIYREIYTKHFPGIDKLFTPFFTGIHKEKSLIKKGFELSQTNHNGIPVVPQILSKDAEEIIRFVNFCKDKGFEEVNWNLGCPYPRVANKKRGSGLLPYPDLVDEILQKVMPVIELNFSVKCRLGYFKPDEIIKLIPVFNRYKIYELTIHARIGKQLYKGGVDIGSFEKAMHLSEVSVVYNGDIFSVEEFENFTLTFPEINSWMIGRGLLIDPYLPGDIKGLFSLSREERKKGIRKFMDDLYYAYRKNNNDSLHTISLLKELWSHLALSFQHPEKVFNIIKKTGTFDAYEDAVYRVFNQFEWEGSKGRTIN